MPVMNMADVVAGLGMAGWGPDVTHRSNHDMRLAPMVLLVPLLLGAASAHAATPPDGGQGRALLFADEFNDGKLDRSKWGVIGPDFWVNNEQQAYVDAPETIRFLPAGAVEGADGGVLVAIVTHEGPERAVAQALERLRGSASLAGAPLWMHILG